ncbi:hypothetical protein [Streptacidiphilus sp. MAP5-3]|uniref:hypothetical protein n=1 Tax=unclassified Streptacidiphilus TaxID=2643834 RepID=UPI0035111B46
MSPQQPSPADQSERTCVVVYVATSEDDAAELVAGHCVRHAAALGWVLATGPIRDTDRSLPLGERPGWRAVKALLAEGGVHGVVTYSREMIALIPAAQEQAAAALAEREMFLAFSRAPAAPGPLPRRQRAERPAGTARSAWPEAFTPRTPAQSAVGPAV